jgi:hypothetical protein
VAQIEGDPDSPVSPGLGPAAEPYRTGKSGALMRAGQILAACGTVGALLGRRNRAISAMSGAALLAGSAVTRFGVFEAGRVSAHDPDTRSHRSGSALHSEAAQ